MRSRPTLLLLALASSLWVAGDCSEVEQARRRQHGISDTPVGAALVAGVIAGLADRMGGAVPQPDGSDPSLAERMAFHEVPGVTVAVVHDGRVEWVEAFGTRGEDDPRPLGPYCYFQGASLSKVITAVAALRAVEEGLLELDAPLNDALVSWDVPENEHTTETPVTLRRALSHTAGLGVPSFLGYLAGTPLPSTLDVLDGLGSAINPAIRVFQPPASDWYYSGGGFVVVQQAIEDVTGSYRGWARQAVFEPARMWSSGFHQPAPPDVLDHAAIGNANGSDLPAPRVYPELAAAGVWTQALDLARLVLAIQRSLAGEPGGVLQPATAQAMVTPQSPSPGFLDIGLDGTPGMGLGLFLVNRDDPSWFWHTGENLGYTSVIVGSLERQDGVVVMTNGQRFFFGGGRILAWEIVHAVARLYGWDDWLGWGH